MTIPDYQSIMLPLLEYTADGKEHYFRDAVEAMAVKFNLSPEEKMELLPSGRKPTFDDRVGWARTYMKHAGLLESTRRGHFRITQRGREVLSRRPPKIDVSFLSRFPEFNEFSFRRRESIVESDQRIDSLNDTPEELLENSFKVINQNLADEILRNIKSCSPAFFEKLVVDVLLKIGYGGSRQDAGRAIGRAADGEIDGIIKEDRPGLDVIYIQAKRWENVVGRPEVQKFAGALQGHRAKKGVFMTSSSFTEEAKEFARQIENKIILIDGRMLADLMIENNVGVSPIASYEIKKIDSDYFTED